MFLHQLIRHLETSKRFDLPLRGTVPNGIGAPQDVVHTNSLDDLPEQMSTNQGVRRYQLTECRPEFHVDVLNLRLGLLHATELRSPGNLTGLGKEIGHRRGTSEPRVIDQ